MNTVLSCKALTKIYKDTKALDGIDLDVKKGRIVGLLGPNGSGKTTLIKLVNGLLTPTAGNIAVCGVPVGIESKKHISFLPDKNFLTPWMTTDQMVNYFADFFPDFRRERADEMLKNLDIDRTKKIKTLSKGMQEKVGLILVMSRKAKLYLLDEPIAGVDPASRDYILHTVISNYDREASILISTHLIADVETVLDDVIFIDRGHIILSDTTENIKQNQGKSIDVLFREMFRC